VTNKRGTDKTQTGWTADHTSLQEVCTGGQALPSEGVRARVFALWAAKSRLQSGRAEAEDIREEGG
jgi:hypothetical protein